MMLIQIMFFHHLWNIQLSSSLLLMLDVRQIRQPNLAPNLILPAAAPMTPVLLYPLSQVQIFSFSHFINTIKADKISTVES
jgi:hypothetical protein